MRPDGKTYLLLVEDNRGDARLLVELLSEDIRMKIEITQVSSMRAAEHHLAQHTPDIILLDLGLPDAQGMEAVRRAHEAAPSVALVVLTGTDDETLASQTLQGGAQDYLVKGMIETRGLVRALRHAMERQNLEEALSAQQERDNFTLNCLSDAVASTNISGNITFLNIQAEKLTGWLREDAEGRPMAEVIQILRRGSHEPIMDTMGVSVETDRIVSLPASSILIRRDGFEAPIEDSVAPIHDRQGRATGAVIVFRDISVRRAAETHLAQMEGRYRGLLEAAPDAMVVVNLAGEIVLLNVQAEKQFGYRRDELLGQPVKNLIPEGFAERLVADDLRSEEDALDQTIGAGIELTALRKDGTEFPIEIMLSPLDSPEGVLITAAIRDISVRRAAETHLAQMEGRYRGLLEAAPDAMVVVNLAGEIVLLNVQAEKQFGYRRDELLGQPVKNLIPEGFAERLVADDLRSAEDALDQTIGTGIELTALRKDGSEFPIEIMLSPLDSPEGVLITAAIRDISVRRAAETHLAQMEGRYRGLLEAAPDAMVVVNLAGEIVLLNVQAEKQFGYRRDELLGQPVKNLIPEGFAERLVADDLRSAEDALDQTIGTGIELTALRKDGSEFPIEIMLSPLDSPEGVLITAAIRDISVRRAAETHLAQMEGRYRGLLEAAPDAMVVVNLAGEIVLLNVQAEKQFGYRRDELLGQPVKNLIPEGFAERLVADDLRSEEDALDQTIGAGIELTALRKDGTEFPIEIMLSPLDSAEGVLITAAIRDISVRRAADTHLDQMEGRYRGLLEAAPDAMVVVNLAGEIVLLNVQAEKQFGYRRDELLGQPVKNLIPEGFAERLVADDLRSEEDALDQTIGAGIELTALRKDGTEFPIEIMLSPLDSPEGVLITAAIRDISVRRAMAQQMAHSAEHDFLTGLPNRLLLVDRVGQAVALAERHGKKIALLYLDLDGFKHINDSLGHPTGDRVLQSVAKRLEACVRTSDTVSRQGGDEFVLLISELDRWESVTATAIRIKTSLEQAHVIDQRDLHVTASIGISIYPDDGLDAETLIKNADTAMYQAKEDGRQSYQFFKEAMYIKAVQRQSIEASLRHALERDEFMLYYQPKVSLSTGDITGAEALIRWTHPTRGMMSPADFIPIAEDSGLILPIGRWVLREACRQAKIWIDGGLFHGRMAVNISAMEFRSDSFPESIFATLDHTGLDPRFLEVEITESMLMKRPEGAEINLKALRARGVEVAIDDFGTGYSSLSYLRKFQIDVLKIDQSFVRELSAAPPETSIVTAVISMGRNLKLRVIAEGVETYDDLAFLQLQNCDEAQGYYFSRPVPPLQFVKLLQRGRFSLFRDDLVETGKVLFRAAGE